MGLIERVAERKRRADQRRGERAWPVGAGALTGLDSTWGHDDSQFAPEEYGDYVATSNEIYSVVSLRARLMSSLRLNLYRGDDSEKKPMPKHRATKLLRYVNPYWTEMRLSRMDEMSMGLWGKTFWAVEKGKDGLPSEIWWMRPDRVWPVPHESKYLSGFLYKPVIGGPDIPFAADEVIWFRYPNPLDEFAPLSPLAAARLAADTASAMMSSNRNLFKQGLQLGGLIVPPADKVTFTPEQANDLADQLQKRFSGVDRAHRWAVLRYEAQLKQLSLTPKDAEFTAGLKMTMRQVCNAYGIHASLLNASDQELANVLGEATRAVWEHTLVPDSRLRAAEIVEQYLPMWPGYGPNYAEHDYSKVPALQESASVVWIRDAQALDRGAITINEWRRRNGLPDVPWGNEPWMPVNKARVVDGELQIPSLADGTPVDPNTLPDDEHNPANQPTTPRLFVDHNEARRLIAEAFGDAGRINGRPRAGW